MRRLNQALCYQNTQEEYQVYSVPTEVAKENAGTENI